MSLAFVGAVLCFAIALCGFAFIIVTFAKVVTRDKPRRRNRKNSFAVRARKVLRS